MKHLSLGLCVGLLCLIAADVAIADDSIVCQSQKGQTRHCPADTRGGVTLETQLSRAGCYEGSSWGHDRHGIWVSNGCRAEFHVGNPGASRGSSNKDSSAAALAALAIIGAAAMAESEHEKHERRREDQRYAAMANEEWRRSGGGRYDNYGAGDHDVVRCESVNNEWTSCPAMLSHARADIQRQLSKSPCRYGQDWNYDASAIYVYNGCRAEFRVEQ